MEILSRFRAKALFLNMKNQWKDWRFIFAKSHALSKMFKVLKIHQEQYFFKHWIKRSALASKYRWKSAIILQSAIRMWIIKRYVLNYYSWRRKLIRVQSLARSYLVLKVFRWDIYYYRAAKLIQKRFRGMRTRMHMLDLRVMGIHYAAENNSYDKLLYLAGKFPELLNELDRYGNTPLHSAAKNASRRTLKLLLKYNLDPNALNVRGYTPLHLCIMSNAVHRDDCCLYMLERGFDEDIDAPEGKTSLLLACEHGRSVIARQLIRNGMDPTVPALNGLTCLQAACSQGLLPLVLDLIENHADVTAPGYCGTYPLHDCIASANVEIAHALFNNGAYVNVVEPYYNQTPLMWACQAGVAELVRLYILQGATIEAVDYQRRTAAHFAAISNSVDVYNLLREADANFDVVDADGNSPLHVAAEHDSAKFCQAVLEGGANPSIQNNSGDQAAHIAARLNHVSCLVHIAKYDEHMGRINYAHQTPLGAAKFACAKEAQFFIEDHFRRLEHTVSNNDGSVWWDKPVDDLTDGWEVVVGPLNQRVYINKLTGEKQDRPPNVAVSVLKEVAKKNELNLRRKIKVVTEGSSLNRHDYIHEYAHMEVEIEKIAVLHRSATIISKTIRRKLAYLALAREVNIKNKKQTIAKFLKRTLPKFMKWKRSKRNLMISKLQARWRGYAYRKVYYASIYSELWYHRLQFRLVRNIWALWKNYKIKRMRRKFEIAKKLPRTQADWAKILLETPKPNRTVGVYEEYLYPRTTDIYFYRNKLTGVCVFDKPKKLAEIDANAFSERVQKQRFGATLKQVALAVKLQAIWKGFKVRSYYKSIETALNISVAAESNYLKDPQKAGNLFNYALHCHVFLHDDNRARKLYMEGLRQMNFKGPDDANLLYAYTIYVFVTHEQDFADILMLLTRARKAEEQRENLRSIKETGAPSQAVKNGTYTHGRSFALANSGFFRNAATSQNTALSWHNYAACRFLVYNDFAGSFDAFLEGFKHDPADTKMSSNFDVMMEHFHGNDKTHLAEIVRLRLRKHAEEDEAVANLRYTRREYHRVRNESASKIAIWFKQRMARRGFNKFMANVRKLQADRLQKLMRK